MTRHGLYFAAAIAAAVWAGHPAAAEDPRVISFALPSKSLVAAVPRVAEELGLFEKHHLQPQFTYVESTSGTATALLSGSVDVAETGIPEVLLAHAKGHPLVILANHYNGLAGSLVLSKAVAERLDLPADASEVDRLKALDGLLLAATSAVSNMTQAYKGAAQSVDATPRFSYMAVSAMEAALATGAVDGMIVTAPYWAVSVEKGTGVLWISPANGDLPADAMPSSGALTATTVAFAEANPEVAESLAAVFDDFSSAAAERPEAVKAAMARLYPELSPALLDLILSKEARAFQGTKLTPADIRRDIEFLKRSGMDAGATADIDPDAVIPAY